ncbi:TPA: hypothetical protein ACP2LW_005013, partial [Escherichia coli]
VVTGQIPLLPGQGVQGDMHVRFRCRLRTGRSPQDTPFSLSETRMLASETETAAAPRRTSCSSDDVRRQKPLVLVFFWQQARQVWRKLRGCMLRTTDCPVAYYFAIAGNVEANIMQCFFFWRFILKVRK